MLVLLVILSKTTTELFCFLLCAQLMEQNEFGNTNTIPIAIMGAILEDYPGVRLTPSFCLVCWWEEQATDFLARRKQCSLQWFQWLLVPPCCSHLIRPFQLAALSTDLPVRLQMGPLMQIHSPVMIKETSPCFRPTGTEQDYPAAHSEFCRVCVGFAKRRCVGRMLPFVTRGMIKTAGFQEMAEESVHVLMLN